MDNPTPISVTVQEASKLSGLGITTLYALMKEGRLKTKLVRRRRLIDYKSLREVAAGSEAA